MDKVYTHHYINNCWGAFFRGFLNWFGDEFYPFTTKVISTYDKAVQFFQDREQNRKETDKPMMPAVTLDPQEFHPEERGGRFQWMYPNLHPKFGARISSPILYADNNIIITPVRTRFQGTMEIICWLHSVYEYLDVMTRLHVYSGGTGRWLRPKLFWSYLVLPEALLRMTYTNEYSGESYQIDWNSTENVQTLVKNMGQMKTVYPVLLTPMFRFESINDASQKYGGDDLASWKLGVNVYYEIEIPTFIVVETDWKLEKVNVSVEFGDNAFTQYGTQPPKEIIDSFIEKKPDTEISDKLKSEWQIFEIDPDSLVNSEVILSSEDISVYPDVSQPIKWNPISSGRLKYIEIEKDWQEVQPGDIIFCTEFSDDNLENMRISNGFITTDTNPQSYLLRKVSLLWTPVFYGLSQDQKDILKEYNEQNITIDPYSKVIYKGSLTVERKSESDRDYAHTISEELLEDYPADLEDIKKPPVDFFRFDNEGYRGPVRTFNHKALYEFTEADVVSGENITIPLARSISLSEQLIVVSYMGQMGENVDYELDLVNQTITIKVQAKIGELVEMFFYS